MELKTLSTPAFQDPSFVCPHCTAYAEQKWEIPYKKIGVLALQGVRHAMGYPSGFEELK
jgi:hypothetical protein